MFEYLQTAAICKDDRFRLTVDNTSGRFNTSASGFYDSVTRAGLAAFLLIIFLTGIYHPVRRPVLCISPPISNAGVPANFESTSILSDDNGEITA